MKITIEYETQADAILAIHSPQLRELVSRLDRHLTCCIESGAKVGEYMRDIEDVRNFLYTEARNLGLKI